MDSFVIALEELGKGVDVLWVRSGEASPAGRNAWV
jgi:hypothetical protein